jgi:hypothetical protein
VKGDNNEIKIFHKFDDITVINILNETIIKTLEQIGRKFTTKKGDKITILISVVPTNILPFSSCPA